VPPFRTWPGGRLRKAMRCSCPMFSIVLASRHCLTSRSRWERNDGSCGPLLHRQDGVVHRCLADKIAAAASFHGGGLATDAPDSPHGVLGLPIPARYFGHATNDESMPPEAIERLNAVLKAWGGKYESEVYEGAYHGWTVPDSPAYNQVQAHRAFEKLTQLFAETLS
jgi:hypothetical protein